MSEALWAALLTVIVMTPVLLLLGWYRGRRLPSPVTTYLQAAGALAVGVVVALAIITVVDVQVNPMFVFIAVVAGFAATLAERQRRERHGSGRPPVG